MANYLSTNDLLKLYNVKVFCLNLKEVTKYKKYQILISIPGIDLVYVARIHAKMGLVHCFLSVLRFTNYIIAYSKKNMVAKKVTKSMDDYFHK